MNRFFNISDVAVPEDVKWHLADPITQWRPGCSVYELATCWLGAGGFPLSVRTALDAYPLFKDARLIEAFFGRKVELGTPGHLIQNDLLVYAEISDGFVVIAVEGKARGSFGQYTDQMNLTPDPEWQQTYLAARLGVTMDDMRHIRHRLVHPTVSALLEADRYRANHALMLVHSFSPRDQSFQDFRAFASLLGMPAEGLRPNRVVGSRDYGLRRLHLGWVSEPRPRPGGTCAPRDS